MGRAKRVLLGLLVLLVAGYLGMDLVVSLPPFIFYENIVLAVTYAVFAAMIVRGRNVYPWLALVAGFNAGRVSRSVVTSLGEPGRLALQHTPLLIMLLLVGTLAAYLSYRQEHGQG
ncbi:hypothetical protein Pyrfu_1265 [Pyrolobus fumarii 1A]|uniref:Uncharacterized protein n=1 Tax=Pyrolobus fumarii (strain DSM 11204 / 1A) TaxID=694429 RepID=G0EG99_PYRF1|nr:hypothetical protein [Pyrolobus fumarii]AEM39124.1 hypothetical protein Pyrfu_1265 [Pyrolobus fumarii 1A]